MNRLLFFCFIFVWHTVSATSYGDSEEHFPKNEHHRIFQDLNSAFGLSKLVEGIGAYIHNEIRTSK